MAKRIYALQSNAVNKVQRSVLSTNCDSRIALTTSVVRQRHETGESRTRGRSNMANATEFQNGGPDPRLGVTVELEKVPVNSLDRVSY